MYTVASSLTRTRLISSKPWMLRGIPRQPERRRLRSAVDRIGRPAEVPSRATEPMLMKNHVIDHKIEENNAMAFLLLRFLPMTGTCTPNPCSSLPLTTCSESGLHISLVHPRGTLQPDCGGRGPQLEEMRVSRGYGTTYSSASKLSSLDAFGRAQMRTIHPSANDPPHLPLWVTFPADHRPFRGGGMARQSPPHLDEHMSKA